MKDMAKDNLRSIVWLFLCFAAYCASSTADYRADYFVSHNKKAWGAPFCHETSALVGERPHCLTPPPPPYHVLDSQEKVGRLTAQRVWRLARTAAWLEGLDWTEKDASAMVKIALKESSFDPKAKNPVSSSAGLYGFLDGTRERYGGHGDDPAVQTLAAVRYVSARYSRPVRALRFHERAGWY